MVVSQTPWNFILGQVKFHPASGHRSSLVMRDTAEETSYWVEERQSKKSEIIYYKNFATNGHLGKYNNIFFVGVYYLQLLIQNISF